MARSRRTSPASPPGVAEASRASENRREPLLEAAARLFGSQGYAATSIREIATAVGMLPGSIYYHFKSKDDLLLAVHTEGVEHFWAAYRQALAQAGPDPWQRLEAACVAHLDTLLAASPYAQIVTPEFTRSVPDAMRREMIAQRDRYEQEFIQLIEALPLAPDVDRRTLRLTLFGSLNFALNWYRPGRRTPAAIAADILSLLRRGAAGAPA
jgi:AcrR family transcriptional regulator